MSPQTPEAKLTGGHQAPLQTSAISTRSPDPYYNRAAWLRLHHGLCSFLMSRGAPARGVNSIVATLSGKREPGRRFSGSAETYGSFPDLTHSLGQPIQQQESLRILRKNRGPSESSPRCLNAVNPAV